MNVLRIRNSLWTVLAVHLALLLLVSMLLTGMVVLRLVEQDVIRTRVSGARAILEGLRPNGDAAETFFSAIEAVCAGLGYESLLMISTDGSTLFTSRISEKNRAVVETAEASVASGKEVLRFAGRTWGVVWLAYRSAHLAVPLVVEGRMIGAVAVEIPLEPTYTALRNRQRAVLFYMALNALFLTLFGTYRLGRIMIHPIRRLLAATEHFTGDEPFPSLYEAKSTEIGQIHRSLHAMLKRLADNKESLREQLMRLEKSNIELKNAHRELITSEKLASVGRLATGVAHEIGNPLGIVLGYLELMKNGKLSPDETSDFLGRIETELTKIHVTIRQMLDFSRPASGNPGPVSLHAVVTSALSVLEPHPMMGPINVRLELNCSPDQVWADVNQLQQVMINIIINAVDAMEGDANPEIFISTSREGDSIRLMIKDTGPGVEEETLARIFEPFYTTKEPGKGTGMGLAVCYRVIEAAGGTIVATNGETGGLVVSITLPVPDLGPDGNPEGCGSDPQRAEYYGP